MSNICGVSTTDGQILDSKDSISTKLQNGSIDKECICCEEYHELDSLFPERMSYGSMSGDHSGKLCSRVNDDIIKQPKSFYSIFINRWISLLGTILFSCLMFGVEWRYSLVGIGVWCILYFYIGLVSPGLFPGVAEFSCISSMTDIPKKLRSKDMKGEREILIPTNTPHIITESVNVTDESLDYIDRDRYHQAQVRILMDNNIGTIH